MKKGNPLVEQALSMPVGQASRLSKGHIVYRTAETAVLPERADFVILSPSHFIPSPSLVIPSEARNLVFMLGTGSAKNF